MPENNEQGELGGGAAVDSSKPKQRSVTRYRILWGKLPDPEAEREDEEIVPRPTYREILNPLEKDGAYVATSAETARRTAFHDDTTDQFPFMQRALKAHGLVLKHVALTSWGDDAAALADPLKIQVREDLGGKI